MEKSTLRASILTAFLLLLSPLQLAAQSKPEWPLDDWPTKSLTRAGFDKYKFRDFVGQAFAPQLTFVTNSVLVIKDGHLVYEAYANGYHKDQKHALFSLGKTMINALIGVLEVDGRLHRDDQVRRHYPAVEAFGRKDLTITDLLHMSSGIDWIEEDRENLLQSDPWFAFYSRDSNKDMPAWVSRRAQSLPANRKFNYSSGDSALLVAALRGAIGERDYSSYSWTNFFDKLGMKTVTIERDGAGNQGLHGIGYASPRDIARLGLLYLRDGRVNGQQLWPADWAAFTARMAPSQHNLPDPKDRNLQNNQAYGAQVWLNVKRAGDKERPYPELPANALLGLGTRGQVLLILPDEDLIFVRTATDSELSLKARKRYRKKLFTALYRSLKRSAP